MDESERLDYEIRRLTQYLVLRISFMLLGFWHLTRVTDTTMLVVVGTVGLIVLTHVVFVGLADYEGLLDED